MQPDSVSASYDYVVVGGGSAGCVLANRLSANPGVSVCLLEAGPADRHPLIHMPVGIIFMMLSKVLNWRYFTEPQQHLEQRHHAVLILRREPVQITENAVILADADGTVVDTVMVDGPKAVVSFCRLPDAISFETGAAMMLKGLTAQYLLKKTLPQGGLAALQSTFAQPTLILILAVVGLSTLLAAWVTAAVTRPLVQLSTTVASVTRHGLEDFAATADARSGTIGLAQTTARDEFGQLNNGIRVMLNTLQAQWNTLRRLDHFRREGVSNLSHDLRSPLTATTACLETLEGRWAGDAARESDRQLVEVALRNTHNAARLVQSK